MNKVILSGNLCRDIELRVSQGNKSVVSNCIAVKREYKNAQGEYESDFINIVAWGNQAEYLNNFARKGDRVELVGRWQVRTFQDQYNNDRQANEAVIESITVFSKDPKADAPAPAQETKPNNELPFNEDDIPF